MRDYRGLKEGDRLKDGELVGRRINKPVSLIGATGQPPPPTKYFVNDFEESRPPYHISMDWLGRGNLEQKPCRLLGALAERQQKSREPPHRFLGWAYLRTDKLTKCAGTKCDLSASPDYPDQPDHIDNNPYHLLVKYSPEQFAKPVHLATHMAYLFYANDAVFLGHTSAAMDALPLRWQDRVTGFWTRMASFFGKDKKPDETA